MIVDVVMNFVTIAELNGGTRKQLVLAHCGMRTIFGWRIMRGTRMMRMKKKKMMMKMDFMSLIILTIITKFLYIPFL